MKFALLKIKILRLLVIAVATVLICRYVFIPFRTHGISMEPTYVDGRFCFANRLSYWFSEPRRGDIVVIRSNEKPKPRYLLKRLVALPNERLEIIRGTTHINDEPYYEPYVHGGSNWHLSTIELDSEHYYVIGDNRTMDIS